MPLHFKLSDLSPAQQEQVKRQLSPSSRLNSLPKPQPCRRPKISRNGKTLSDIGSLSPSSSAGASSEALELVPYSCSPSSFSIPPARNLREEQMSKPEIEYLRDVLHGNGLYEAITLKSPSGNRYTADFLSFIDGKPTLIEVKGAYRLESQARAHTAFMEAAANFSSVFQFLWVKREKKGAWTTKIVIPAAATDSNSVSSSSTSVQIPRPTL